VSDTSYAYDLYMTVANGLESTYDSGMVTPIEWEKILHNLRIIECDIEDDEERSMAQSRYWELRDHRELRRVWCTY
jgi:hypothetical protein